MLRASRNEETRNEKRKKKRRNEKQETRNKKRETRNENRETKKKRRNEKQASSIISILYLSILPTKKTLKTKQNAKKTRQMHYPHDAKEHMFDGKIKSFSSSAVNGLLLTAARSVWRPSRKSTATAVCRS